MNLNEKLDQFYHAAIESATSQNVQIVEEYQKSLQTVFEEHKEGALRKAEAAYQAESDKLIRNKNRELSDEAIKQKRKISEKSAELTDKLFQEVMAILLPFKTTPVYYELLCSQIKEAVEFARGDSITIYIDPSDQALKTSLEADTLAVLTVSTREFTGGIRAVITDKNILIDHSFLTRLEELHSSFVFEPD
jgi:vacuolar-type H+-ATPase subunit E/Vma4